MYGHNFIAFMVNRGKLPIWNYSVLKWYRTIIFVPTLFNVTSLTLESANLVQDKYLWRFFQIIPCLLTGFNHVWCCLMCLNCSHVFVSGQILVL